MIEMKAALKKSIAAFGWAIIYSLGWRL